MALFSHNVNKISGLRFIAEALELQSGIGRQHLMKQPFMTLHDEISRHYDKVDEIINLLISHNQSVSDKGDSLQKIEDIKHALSEVHDISGTLSALQSGMVLDDIGLFEVKRFALITKRISDYLYELNSAIIKFSDTENVLRILDPERQNAPHFYIYDSYSNKLQDLRRQYNQHTKLALEGNQAGESKQFLLDKAEELRIRCQDEEDIIRQDLSKKLRSFSVALMDNLSQVADLDLYIAKADLALSLNLCRPTIADKGNNTIVKGLFNPGVSSVLKVKNKLFQPVDIEISKSPSVITGANMAGKTVLLKTIALSQYLFQYGFHIPASSAEMVVVDKIITVLEDEQSELKGLSSFAAEMLKINNILNTSKSGTNILALIDEPARTTNPQEGLAIVNAIIEQLARYKTRSLITTHYSGIKPNVRHLRVAGLKTELLNEVASVETINDYMDYSIIELDENERKDAPHEALKIAKIIGVDEDMLKLAEKYLKET